jgi:phosphatidylinositol glycan class M
MQIRSLLVISIVLRACLIAYGVIQDRFLPVKYTDIDYNVFTDAARYVTLGQSPYLRSTYRYSPLLAYLLVPNILVNGLWGKVRGSCSNAVWLCQGWTHGIQLNGSQCLPNGSSNPVIDVSAAIHSSLMVLSSSSKTLQHITTLHSSSSSSSILLLFSTPGGAAAQGYVLVCTVQVVFAAADIVAAWQIWRTGQLQHASQQRCFWSVVLWLYNPFTVTISTRGSCDSLVTVLLLAVLILLLQGQRIMAAVLYGLAVHFRIYPIIYSPAVVLYLARQQLKPQRWQQQQQHIHHQDGCGSSSREVRHHCSPLLSY